MKIRTGLIVSYVAIAIVFVLGYVTVGVGFNIDEVYVAILGSWICSSSLTSGIWLTALSFIPQEQNEDVSRVPSTPEYETPQLVDDPDG